MIPSGDKKPKFENEIFEWLTNKNIIKKAQTNGYKDFKNMLFGNIDSSPLSLKAIVNKNGYAFLCEPPGNWGKLPLGFERFWFANTSLYLTENIGSYSDFVFNEKTAREVQYFTDFPKETQLVCVQLVEPLVKGNHVLTIVPRSTKKIAFTYLLLP